MVVFENTTERIPCLPETGTCYGRGTLGMFSEPRTIDSRRYCLHTARMVAYTCRQGLTSSCQVVVGVPMLTSAQNARFWLQLCGAQRLDGASELVTHLSEGCAAASNAQSFTKEFNATLIKKARLIEALLCVP